MTAIGWQWFEGGWDAVNVKSAAAAAGRAGSLSPVSAAAAAALLARNVRCPPFAVRPPDCCLQLLSLPCPSTTQEMPRLAATAACAALGCALLHLCLGASDAVVRVPWGVPLEELHAWSALQGGAGWPSNTSLTLVDAPVQGRRRQGLPAPLFAGGSSPGSPFSQHRHRCTAAPPPPNADQRPARLAAPAARHRQAFSQRGHGAGAERRPDHQVLPRELAQALRRCRAAAAKATATTPSRPWSAQAAPWGLFPGGAAQRAGAAVSQRH